MCASLKIGEGAFAFQEFIKEPRLAKATEVFLWIGGREAMQRSATPSFTGSNPVLSSNLYKYFGVRISIFTQNVVLTASITSARIGIESHLSAAHCVR